MAVCKLSTDFIAVPQLRSNPTQPITAATRTVEQFQPITLDCRQFTVNLLHGNLSILGYISFSLFRPRMLQVPRTFSISGRNYIDKEEVPSIVTLVSLWLEGLQAKVV